MTGGLSDYFEAPKAVLVFFRGIADANAFVGGDIAGKTIVDDIEVITADALAV